MKGGGGDVSVGRSLQFREVRLKLFNTIGSVNYPVSSVGEALHWGKGGEIEGGKRLHQRGKKKGKTVK